MKDDLHCIPAPCLTCFLQNFVETNRLWVRLQTQGPAKDKKKREKERLDLRILVGVNLVRLSQLEGLGVQEYKLNVLPKILEEVVSCKDTIAQSYLMDCIIQVFPDEFHLATLETFLHNCTLLKEKVSVRTILDALMNRLASHTASNAANATTAAAAEVSPELANSFRLFNDCITTLIEERTNMSLTETLRLQTVLVNFALKCHPGKIDYVAHCLGASALLIEKTDFISVLNSGCGYIPTLFSYHYIIFHVNILIQRVPIIVSDVGIIAEESWVCSRRPRSRSRSFCPPRSAAWLSECWRSLHSAS